LNLNTASREIITATRKVIALQLGAGIAIAAVFFMAEGKAEALAAFYGGMIGVVIAFLLGRGVVRAAEAARRDHKRSMLILYVGAAQRFILVLVLFGVGLKGLNLAFLPMIAGFGGAQLAYLSSMRRG
jgi:ATP synthase protein I